MSKIEALSSEQEKRIPLIRQEWIDRASQPIDRVKAKAAIDALYAFNGKESPDIIWVASPASACLLLALIKNGSSNLDSRGDSLRDSLRASLGD